MFTVKQRVSTVHNFSTYEDMYMYNNKHITLFFSTYLPICIPEFSYHHVTFKLTNPSQYATINIRSHVRVHWFDWCEGLLDLLNVKRRPSTQMFDLQRRVRVQIFT